MPVRCADLPGGIGANAGGSAVPDEHFINVRGRNSRAFDGSLRRHRTQLRSVDVLERPAKPANRRPRGAQNNHVPHCHRVPIISNDRSNNALGADPYGSLNAAVGADHHARTPITAAADAH